MCTRNELANINSTSVIDSPGVGYVDNVVSTETSDPSPPLHLSPPSRRTPPTVDSDGSPSIFGHLHRVFYFVCGDGRSHDPRADAVVSLPSAIRRTIYKVFCHRVGTRIKNIYTTDSSCIDVYIYIFFFSRT